MASDNPRLRTVQLNELFVSSLGKQSHVIGNLTDKPLLVDAAIPFDVKLRVYLYNCTNPPGGRASDEYKSQIIVPGQERGARGNFLYSEDRIVILGAYAQMTSDMESGVFVFWDPMFHVDFAYSANIQVKSEVLIRAFAELVSYGEKNNGETIIACRPQNLREGIKARITTVSLPQTGR